MTHHPIFSAFEPVTSEASGSHVYDFIGAATSVFYKRAWAAHAIAAGRKFTPKPPPLNEHYLDWIAVLTCVSRARGIFRMAELGAGWAPWLVRAALATRQRPEITALELLAIEADPVHFHWISEHFQDNGLDPEAHTIVHGAASAAPGELEFPVIEDPDVDYGASLRQAASAMETIRVPGWSLPQILERFTGPVDFLHADIQGAEYDCLPPAMDKLRNAVKTIMIGTHLSNASHDGLAQTFRDAGWRETLTLPRNTTSILPWGEIRLNDGFLLFDNPDFL